ncbi:hypothetical protein [Cytobacillus firmus]|nr:hypothetical protein [Cytobacillus firmus]
MIRICKRKVIITAKAEVERVLATSMDLLRTGSQTVSQSPKFSYVTT